MPNNKRQIGAIASITVPASETANTQSCLAISKSLLGWDVRLGVRRLLDVNQAFPPKGDVRFESNSDFGAHNWKFGFTRKRTSSASPVISE